MENGYKDITTEQLTRSLTKTSGKFYLAVFVLFCITVWGAFAWIFQLVKGLGVTGMNNSVAWGVYITNFVFFIGISNAGTLISAILRVSHAEWRMPITRAAEAITVFALMIGGIQIMFDLAHPERMLNVIIYGRLTSPLLWDVICISIYLLSCIFYLFLPLIPDMAILKNKSDISEWRKKLYRLLSVGWNGNREQKRRLEKTIGIMAILLLPIAVLVHSVLSWIFGMTIRPMWHSTILGPYFVTGAIFSGIAAIIIAMAIIRKTNNLENYLQPVHFNNLGILLIVMTSLWFYFTFAEFLTTGYGALTEELAVFNAKITGEFSMMFWIMVGCMTIAFFLLLFRKKWVIVATTLASLFIVVGMWIERFTIVVPTLTKTAEQGYKAGIYHPTWVEWSISFGSLAALVLMYVIFVKLFPIISIWEVKEGREAIQLATKKMETYLPIETFETHALVNK